jgi:pimeloyl-ACP methyl ester carboxylesterase
MLLAALSGCAALQSPAERADAQAKTGQFQPVAALAGTPVRAWLRQPLPAAAASAGENGVLTVYIEGDGAEWRGKFQPPVDPTPDNLLPLRLALRDPGASVAYLGRPCQYLEPDALAQCPSILWLRARFGEHALTIMSAALDVLLLSANAQRLHLVGYSGGGVIAALLAARRTDVSCLVTVASPLDIDAWAQAIEIAPLADSLNPLALAPQLVSVAQTHIAGTADDVVPARTLRRFTETLPDARVEVIAGYDHDCCWVHAWERLRQRTCLAMP